MNQSISPSYQRTRWLTLFGTIITQFALGSVYTWSLFNGQLAAKLDEPVSQVAFSFGLLSLGLAVASSLAGKLQERFGVRRVTIGAGILMALGFWLTAHASNLMMLYLSAGIMVGLADGAGYLMTLSNCVKWFPERKGVISACAIGAYGLGSLGFKFICGALLGAVGLEQTFILWGLMAMGMILVGALMMRDAPVQRAAGPVAQQARDYTLAESVRLPQYWMLAMMFLTACMSGLYVIGVAKDIGEGLVHLSTQTAANAVTIIAIANLSGRLVLGVLFGSGSLWSLSLAAMAGALLITLILLHFAHRQLSVTRLLLTGVALGIICSAIMTWAVYFSTSLDLRQLMYWMMGGFSGIDWRYGWMMLALLPVTAGLLATARVLNLLALGETSAQQLGLSLFFWRNALVLAMGWLVGVSVAMAGAIGFVGLVIPHLLRLSGISDHRYLLPASALAGAAVLLAADIIARLALTAAELPIGVVTATLGAPLFIALLVKSSR